MIELQKEIHNFLDRDDISREYKEDVEKYLESGMNGHVKKPLDFDEIIIVLRQYLS